MLVLMLVLVLVLVSRPKPEYDQNMDDDCFLLNGLFSQSSLVLSSPGSGKSGNHTDEESDKMNENVQQDKGHKNVAMTHTS